MLTQIVREAPEWINKLRIFPRLFIISYIWMFYQTGNWFMALEDPNAAQSAFVSIITGAGAAWFGLYVSTGNGDARVRAETSDRGSKADFEYEEAEYREAKQDYNPYAN